MDKGRSLVNDCGLCGYRVRDVYPYQWERLRAAFRHLPSRQPFVARLLHPTSLVF